MIPVSPTWLVCLPLYYVVTPSSQIEYLEALRQSNTISLSQYLSQPSQCNMWQIIGSPNHFEDGSTDAPLHVDKENRDATSAAATTAATQSEIFDLSSSTLTDDESSRTHASNQPEIQAPSKTRRPILASILEPIFESLNDEIKRDDESIARRNIIYGSNAKESHPFFDDRFIEVDGMVVLDPEWKEKQTAIREQRPLRRGRRRPRSEQTRQEYM